MDRPIAIRCDGGAANGAGHVSRCLPVAQALRHRGAQVCFVGRYDGVAAWLIGRSGLATAPTADGPCGLDASRWTGALVDLYLEDVSEICDLATALPVATLGESTRCPDAGTWVDYHAASAPGIDARRLGGPTFAPLDPRFAAGRRARESVERVLVMAGASTLFDDVAVQLAEATATAFPGAVVVAPERIASGTALPIHPIATPFDLAELAPQLDLAVVAAGMTCYELASAAIPVVAVSLAENQQIVVDGCRSTGIAVGVDGVNRDPISDVRAALLSLSDRSKRAEVANTAAHMLDGRGADRIADALLTAWAHPGTTRLGR